MPLVPPQQVGTYVRAQLQNHRQNGGNEDSLHGVAFNAAIAGFLHGCGI